MGDDRSGVWLAYYPDWSGFAVFGSEVEALRYAVENSMQCQWVSFGESIREAVASR